MTLPMGDIEDEEQAAMDREWQKKRKEEFERHIDDNHDGKVTVKELLVSFELAGRSPEELMLSPSRWRRRLRRLLRPR